MNASTELNGLSARQKTRSNFLFYLKPYWFLLATALLVSSCHKKTNGQDSPESNNESALVKPDSLNKPKVNIKVNKHYDDKGNVIGFDSTYTSFYSNVEGDTSTMDSLMRSFESYFSRSEKSFFGRDFDSSFFGDSTRYSDFFHNDFFMKPYELNDSYFRDMMRRMDSIKNDFYRNNNLERKRNGMKEL